MIIHFVIYGITIKDYHIIRCIYYGIWDIFCYWCITIEKNDWISIANPDKKKIKETLRLFDELAYQEKIVVGYGDAEMLELIKRKIEEIRKVLTS